MIVVLQPGPEGPRLSLERPQEFDRFHLEVRGYAASADLDAELRRAGLGSCDSDDYVWIEPAGLRELAGAERPEGWDAELEAMITYAAGKGWTRDGAIQAHVERVETG